MSADSVDRAALAAAQEQLLAALVTGAPAPPGFDAERVRVQARALLAKRTGVAAAHHPWLVEALGEGEYARRFAAYAADHARPAGTGGHTDALSFESHLRADGTLPGPPSGGVGRRRLRLLPTRRSAPPG